MVSLQTRMTLLVMALFAIIYATIVIIGTAIGVYDFYFYLLISLGIMMKAFFLNDPSQAVNEIHELSELGLDKSGTIDSELSTHPNMLKRIKQLSQYT